MSPASPTSLQPRMRPQIKRQRPGKGRKASEITDARDLARRSIAAESASSGASPLDMLTDFGSGVGLGLLTPPLAQGWPSRSERRSREQLLAKSPPKKTFPTISREASTHDETIARSPDNAPNTSLAERHWNTTQTSSSSWTVANSPRTSNSGKRLQASSTNPCPPPPTRSASSPAPSSPAISSASNSPNLSPSTFTSPPLPSPTSANPFMANFTSAYTPTTNTTSTEGSSASSTAEAATDTAQTPTFHRAQGQPGEAQTDGVPIAAVASAAGSVVILIVVIGLLIHRCRRRNDRKRLEGILDRFESGAELSGEGSRSTFASPRFSMAQASESQKTGFRTTSLYGISNDELATAEEGHGDEVRVINHLANLSQLEAANNAVSEDRGRVSAELVNSGILSTDLMPSRDASFSWAHPTLTLPPAAARALKQSHYVKRRLTMEQGLVGSVTVSTNLASTKDGATSEMTDLYARSWADTVQSSTSDGTRECSTDDSVQSDSANSDSLVPASMAWTSSTHTNLRAPRLPPMLVPSITLTLDDGHLGLIHRPLSLVSSESSYSTFDEDSTADESLANYTSDTSFTSSCLDTKRSLPALTKSRESNGAYGSAYSEAVFHRPRSGESCADVELFHPQSVKNCLEDFDVPTLPPLSRFETRDGFRSPR